MATERVTDQPTTAAAKYPHDVPEDPDPPQAYARMNVGTSVASIVAGGAAMFFCLNGLMVAFIVAMAISLGLAIINLLVGLVREWKRCMGEYRRACEEVRAFKEGRVQSREAGGASTARTAGAAPALD